MYFTQKYVYLQNENHILFTLENVVYKPYI